MLGRRTSRVFSAAAGNSVPQNNSLNGGCGWEAGPVVGDRSAMTLPEAFTGWPFLC